MPANVAKKETSSGAAEGLNNALSKQSSLRFGRPPAFSADGVIVNTAYWLHYLSTVTG